ncbi:MAG: DUF1284 domain-containing protein [Lachnospiraceae bacterium]
MCNKLRPHHGLCIQFFEGNGYSEEFVSHMKKVIAKLKHDPFICVTAQEDNICAHCPNMESNGCKTKEKVLRYDHKVLQLCQLSNGQKIQWNEFAARVKESIIEAGKIGEVCKDCGWSEICHNHLPTHKKHSLV